MIALLGLVRIGFFIGGLALKTYHLTRRPADWPLRAVVACFAFFVLSAPIRLLPRSESVLGLQPTVLAAIEYSLIMCACLCIMLVFAGRRRPEASPRPSLALQLPLLAVAVVATVALGALAPASVPMGSYTNPWAAAMYLVSELYIGTVLLRATVDAAAVARSSGAGRTQALGMLVAALGLAVLAVASLLLAAVQLTTLTSGVYLRGLGRVGGYGLLFGGPIFVLGICYPGIVMRWRAVSLRRTRLQEYRRLKPLWQLLAETFPEQQLRRGPAGPLAALRLNRAHRRRRVESRDGLVRVSPYVPDHLAQTVDLRHGLPADTLHELARWLLQHCGPDSGLPQANPGAAKPVLVPHSPGRDDDMLLLLALSDEIAAQAGRPSSAAVSTR